jgi:hypothetical protein
MGLIAFIQSLNAGTPIIPGVEIFWGSEVIFMGDTTRTFED